MTGRTTTECARAPALRRWATFALFGAMALLAAAPDAAAQAGDGGQAGAAACDPTTHPHGCTDPKDADAIAAELSNPAGSLASLTFKNQFRFYDGDLPDADDQWNYTLLFQPVFPFPVGFTSDGGKENLFVRPAIPLVVDQPAFDGSDFDGVTARGDIGFDIAYGVTAKSGWIVIGGMVGTLPTATDSRVACKQLRLGPEAFAGMPSTGGLSGSSRSISGTSRAGATPASARPRSSRS
jgi:hypothetical protein